MTVFKGQAFLKENINEKYSIMQQLQDYSANKAAFQLWILCFGFEFFDFTLLKVYESVFVLPLSDGISVGLCVQKP